MKREKGKTRENKQERRKYTDKQTKRIMKNKTDRKQAQRKNKKRQGTSQKGQGRMDR